MTGTVSVSQERQAKGHALQTVPIILGIVIGQQIIDFASSNLLPIAKPVC